ncbi:MAG: SPFH domain-containing protein [Sedimentisphaerales bacterium]|nr:SPFH domain-containing protein [Sedimentisphaerales bacterium]
MKPRNIILLSVVGVILVVLLATMGLVNIQATEAGVKINKLANTVDEKSLPVGWHLYNRIKTSIFVYRVSAKSFPIEADLADVRKAGRFTLELKTKDGQDISVDMTMIYALKTVDVPKLHQDVGPTFEEDVLLPQMRSEGRIVIGSFQAEEIYQGEVRGKIQTGIRDKLNSSLSKYPAIEVRDVLIRDFAFKPEFQQAIEQKKLAAQKIEINKNEALAAEEMAKKMEADARGERLMAVQTATGKADAVKLEADANKYKLEQEAAGQLAVYKAEAEGKRLLAVALEGGANVVALKFAENIPDKLQIWGIPTGSQSMSIMDLSGVFGSMLKTK